jgi:ATP-dependent helicase/nuclease subunit B
LERAAQALVERMGEDAGDWWYVLPGRRAVRQFEEALARVLPVHLEPPRGIAQGAWLDIFRPGERLAIPRRESIHAWSSVLRGLRGGELKLALGVERPAPEAAGAWWALGKRARDLHAEICQAGLSFEQLAEQIPGQNSRWMLWSSMQADYLVGLHGQGMSDGLVDLSASAVRESGNLAFIAVPTGTALERQTLAELGPRFVAVVLAPESGAAQSMPREGGALAAFDEFGFLNQAAWAEAFVPLQLADWFVEDDPASQAQRACQVIREWSQQALQDGNLSHRDVVLAAPDEEVRPFLERHLQRVGLVARDAAGSALEESPPAQLLQALSRMLPDQRFTDVARVLRHTDVEWAMQQHATAAGIEWPEVVGCLDAYHEGHLPRHFRDALNSGYSNSVSMQVVWNGLLQGLGDLVAGQERSLAGWCGPLRELLHWVYADRQFSDTHVQGRVSAAGLRALSEVLDTWEAGHKPWLPNTSASGALTLWVAELAGQNLPPLGQGDGRELEMLGWHELLWDDSAALLLTGFNEGRVPESVPIDMLLPSPIRRSLGLHDEALLAARDVYLTTALIHTKERFALVGGRHSLIGDPLRPSRLAFHRPDGGIPDALQHAFPAEVEAMPEAPQGEAAEARRLPMLSNAPELQRISATDFKAYIASPYLYYVERLLKLGTVSDRERELNPANFGNLVHYVLEQFGQGDLKNSTDASAIQGELERILMARSNRLFGAAAIPSVHLQVQGLKRRLLWFAIVQAERAAEGWRIEYVEWKPESGGVRFGSEGEEVDLIGIIDRIDHHPLHGFAILDYKTGDKSDKPGPAHCNRKGVWSNLQLPMYALLAKELTGEEPVRLGYFNVGKEPDKVHVEMASWDSDALNAAYKVGREVIGGIRAARFEHKAKAPTYSPVMAALVGDTLVGDTSLGAETLEEGAEQ